MFFMVSIWLKTKLRPEFRQRVKLLPTTLEPDTGAGLRNSGSISNPRWPRCSGPLQPYGRTRCSFRFQALGFCLVQPRLLWTFGEWTSGQKTSFSFSFHSSFQIFFKQKNLTILKVSIIIQANLKYKHQSCIHYTTRQLTVTSFGFYFLLEK